MVNGDSFSKETKDLLSSINIKRACCNRAFKCAVNCFSSASEACSGAFSDLFECQSCRAVFIRGAFIACGTVSSPKHAYHLEFSPPNDGLAEYLSILLDECGFPAKKVSRAHRGTPGLYYKDSEIISDILAFMGANDAAFRLIDEKIYRDLRNNANRQANCETANLDKTITAATSQLDAIYSILDGGKAVLLSDELKETLDLRAAYPDYSLEQLAAMHSPPLTKSGVYHRLKKIQKFAKK